MTCVSSDENRGWGAGGGGTGTGAVGLDRLATGAVSSQTAVAVSGLDAASSAMPESGPGTDPAPSRHAGRGNPKGDESADKRKPVYLEPLIRSTPGQSRTR